MITFKKMYRDCISGSGIRVFVCGYLTGRYRLPRLILNLPVKLFMYLRLGDKKKLRINLV